MGMGRPPEEGVTRSVRLDLRLTPAEAEALDRMRAATTRSEYVRQLLRKATS